MFETTKKSAEASTRRFGLATALAAAAFALTPAAHAAEQAPGMRIVKDPVTGQLRAPTAEEAAALSSSEASSRKSLRQAAPRGLITGKANPAAITHADGTVEQELDESSMQYTVMTKNADGSLSMVCVTGKEAADVALKSKSSSKVAKASKEHNHDQK